MTRGPAALATVLLLAALTGCSEEAEPGSGSGLSADEQTAADNLAAQIMRSESVSAGSGDSGDDDQDGVTEDQATCIAEGAVADVGLEALQGYGIVTEDLLVNRGITGVEMSADDADALAGVFVDCVDAEGLFEQQLVRGTGVETGPDVRACVGELVDSESVLEILSMSFQGRTSGDYARLQDEVSQCTAEKDPDR